MLKILKGLAKLFVEDELLAVGIVAVVGLTMLLAAVVPGHPLLAGFALVGGNIAVLVAGAMHTRRRNVRRSPVSTVG